MTTAAHWQNRILGEGEEAPDQLLANPRNWRIHPKAQQDALAGILSEVGWVQRVIVNQRTGHMVDGHARVALAISRNEPTVPVVYVDLSEEEEAAVLATFDPLGAMTVTDQAQLDALLADVSVKDDALRAMLDGLRSEPKAGLTDADAVPEPPPEPISKTGDLWVCGDRRLLCGDSTKAEDVERLMGGQRAILMSTDPPYGIALDQGWRDRASLYRLGAGQDDAIAMDEGFAWTAALAADVDVAYVWHAGLFAGIVAEAIVAAGFDVRQQIIWSKSMQVLSRSAYHGKHEPCWYAVRHGVSAPWYGGRSQTTVWEAASPKQIMGGSTEEKQGHPTQKPIVLSETPIANHTLTGEGVYDPFLGSGTTMIACERLGRRCFGMEIEPRYVDVAVKRWEQFTGKEAQRG